jgi:hypothetical protein
MKWWPWIACFHFTFHLPLQSLFSLSSSYLFLPFRERERGRNEKWECVGLGLLQLMLYSPLSCLWHVGPWVSGGQLILHSLLLFSHLADSPIDLPTVTLCFCEIDPSFWDLAVGSISIFQTITTWLTLVDSGWLMVQITFSDEKQHVSFGLSPSRSLQGLNKVFHWWSKIRDYMVMNSGRYTIAYWSQWMVK